jgi:hypothetical protein
VHRATNTASLTYSACQFTICEPIYGTKRKSPITTYLELNEGVGFQHLALASEGIFKTLREMRKRSGVGGFDSKWTLEWVHNFNLFFTNLRLCHVGINYNIYESMYEVLRFIRDKIIYKVVCCFRKFLPSRNDN